MPNKAPEDTARKLADPHRQRWETEMMKRLISIGILLLAATSALAGPVTNKTYVVGTNVVTRTGHLAVDVMQHPIMASPSIDGSDEEAEFYFDVGDKPGSGNQIIVVHPKEVNIPTEQGRKIELKGTAARISFKGGKVGNAGYENEVFHLQSWRYSEEKTALVQESIQEMTRRLAPGGITKEEAVQIATNAYRVLWGEPPGELKVTKSELNQSKTWEIVLWWDLGLPNGGANFWIHQTGSFQRAEYIPGE